MLAGGRVRVIARPLELFLTSGGAGQGVAFGGIRRRVDGRGFDVRDRHVITDGNVFQRRQHDPPIEKPRHPGIRQRHEPARYASRVCCPCDQGGIGS